MKIEKVLRQLKDCGEKALIIYITEFRGYRRAGVFYC